MAHFKTSFSAFSRKLVPKVFKTCFKSSSCWETVLPDILCCMSCQKCEPNTLSFCSRPSDSAQRRRHSLLRYRRKRNLICRWDYFDVRRTLQTYWSVYKSKPPHLQETLQMTCLSCNCQWPTDTISARHDLLWSFVWFSNKEAYGTSYEAGPLVASPAYVPKSWTCCCSKPVSWQENPVSLSLSSDNTAEKTILETQQSLWKDNPRSRGLNELHHSMILSHLAANWNKELKTSFCK